MASRNNIIFSRGGVPMSSAEFAARLSTNNVVQQDPITGGFEVGGEAVTGATSYTIAQFLILDVANYANYTILISDIPTPHSAVNGVLVRANAAGTGWVWIETPSFTRAQIASNSITAAKASGWRIFVSDIGRGCYMYSDGTRFDIAQPSVVLSNLTSSVPLTPTYPNLPTTASVAKQVEIPRIDGKSIWGDGDILQINQYAEKTGAADTMHTAVYIGQNAKVLDDLETGGTTNTLVTTMPASASNIAAISIVRRLLRKSATSIRLLGPENAAPDGGSVVAKSVDTTIPSLDTATSYVDATIRVSANAADTNLTLAAHTVTLIRGGPA